MNDHESPGFYFLRRSDQTYFILIPTHVFDLTLAILISFTGLYLENFQNFKFHFDIILKALESISVGIFVGRYPNHAASA